MNLLHSCEGSIVVAVLHNNMLQKIRLNMLGHTAQKMKFSIKDFFSKCDQIRRKLRILSHLLKKSLMENIIFYAVSVIFSTLPKYEPPG